MSATTLFPLEFLRQDSTPIDVDSIFTSTSAMSDYLTSPRRYAGQIVGNIEQGVAYKLNSTCDAWIAINTPIATPVLTGTVFGLTPVLNGYGCYSCTFFGCNSGLYNDMVNSIGIGTNALSNYKGGCRNIAIGTDALSPVAIDCCCPPGFNGGCGSDNVAIGAYALSHNYGCCCGSSNTAIGSYALNQNNIIPAESPNGNGSFNTAVGSNASYGNTYGYGNTVVGAYAATSSSVNYCNITIGYNAADIISSALVVTLGNCAISCIRSATGALTSLSDCRDKTNICSIPVGLEFIKALRPVKFEWNMRDNPNDGKTGMIDTGFIAQELDNVVQQFNAEWMQLVTKDDPNRYEATIGKLLPVTVKAIQELSNIITDIELQLGIT